MKKIILSTALALVFSNFLFAQDVWKLDLSHSSAQFSVAHMVISETTGEFKDFDVQLTTNGDNMDEASATATIQVKSISTDDEKRDGHLLSPDFFDVEKYPTLTFKSTEFDKESDNMYKLTGMMNLHGVEQRVVFDAKYNGTVKDPWGNTRSGWKATAVINRIDFGLKYNSVMEAGGVMIGEEVTITLNLEFIKG